MTIYLVHDGKLSVTDLDGRFAVSDVFDFADAHQLHADEYGKEWRLLPATGPAEALALAQRCDDNAEPEYAWFAGLVQAEVKRRLE